MPVHPSIADRMHLLEGIPSLAAAFADPEMGARLDAFLSWPGSTAPPDVHVQDRRADGPHGPVPVRVYRPHDGGPDRPALVWMHGGAFRMGDLDMVEADGVARELCDRAGAVVVSVDYRLAVDGVHHPVPHDDVVAAIRWTRDTAAELGVDATRISAGGASAGGTLATGAALRLRDDDGWLLASLVLVYATLHAVVPPPTPALEALLAELPRPLRFLPEDRAEITRNYLGGPESRADGYAFAALGVLDGLCPTVLLNAEYDDLRASAESFAARLATAGVDVRQILLPEMLHGFLNLPPDLEPVDRALDVLGRVVGDAGAPRTGSHA